MKFSTLLLLSTFTGSNAFYQSHDIITHDDGSVHLFEKTQHRRLATKNLKTHTTANTKFTVHGSEYITQDMHVDGDLTVGGFEFEADANRFGTKALDALAGAGLEIDPNDGGKLTATLALGTTAATALAGNTLTISSAQSTDIAENTADIFTNTADIATNTGDIATNLGNINTHFIDIAANTAFYQENLGLISTAYDLIDINILDIAANTADIATNTADIATNTGDIATNLGNINTHFIDIAANTAFYQENLGLISTAYDLIDINILDIAANTAKPDPYRLEKMVLILCNTLGIKFEHLERAVDGTFDPYERFGAIEINDNDLYDGNSGNNLVDVTTATAAALCSTKTDVACPTGLSNKHALARCADAPCVASDYGLDGGCCAYT